MEWYIARKNNKKESLPKHLAPLIFITGDNTWFGYFDEEKQAFYSTAQGEEEFFIGREVKLGKDEEEVPWSYPEVSEPEQFINHFAEYSRLEDSFRNIQKNIKLN